MTRKKPRGCKSCTAQKWSGIGRLNLCRRVPLVTDENDTSNLSGAGIGPQILAQPGSIGGNAGVSSMGGARIPRGRQRVERPGFAAAFCQDHVSLVPLGGRRARQRVPEAGTEDFA